MNIINKLTITIILGGCWSLVGCKSAVKTETAKIEESSEGLPGSIRQMPKAVIYRTNGDWNVNVAVTLNEDKSQLMYFPDCYDVSVDTEPLALTNGWLLDRQGGISKNTAFLKWTMPEYHEMKKTPSVNEIMDAIIPNAKVLEVVKLPMLTTQAQNDTSAVNAIIREQYLR